MFDDSKAPYRRTNKLHDYACWYVHADTGERTMIYCESMNQYNPGEQVPAANGIDYYVIYFEL